MKRILFISGSVGISHLIRDMAIAKALRRTVSGIDLSWLADEPALTMLKQSGEKVLQESQQMDHGNRILDGPEYEGYELNVMRYFFKLRKGMVENSTRILKVANDGGYDLVIGDEVFDLVDAFDKDITLKKFPCAFIFDFFAADRVSNSPYDLISTYYGNRSFVKWFKARPPIADRFLMIGDVEDFEEKRYGFFLPKRLEFAKEHLHFVGYPLLFDPKDYLDTAKVKQALGYGDEPLLICSKGSTKVGKVLFDLCFAAFPLIRKEMPNLHMVAVLGPSLHVDSVKAPDGVDMRGYVPELYKHFAAADLNICQCGLGTTMELIALQRPFLYFPMEKHFEHAEIAHRCKVHEAGVGMDFSRTTPQDLADAVIENIGKKVSYKPIDTNGADRAAKVIAELI